MSTPANVAMIETFWVSLTPVQRAILATAVEIYINMGVHSARFMEDVNVRLTRIEQGSEKGLANGLTSNVYDHIEDQLKMQGDEATLETVIKGLLAKHSSGFSAR